MDVSDGDLIARYLKGDTDALETLVLRYRRQLFAFVLNMAGGVEDPEEIFQEVWFRAIRRIDAYRDRSFLAWLIRIARNLVIDRWRARRECVSIDEEGRNGAGVGETIVSTEPDAVSRMQTADVERRVAAAVAALPAEQKEVVLLRLSAGLPFKEIAGIQGVSINTALARMQYGLAKLRERLKDDYEQLRAGR